MKDTDERIAAQKPKRSPWDSRIVRAFASGAVLTLISLIIAGFNLSTGGTIKIDDDTNRYFDTCVLQTFVDSTPRIRTEERGFPLSFYQRNHVPVCNEPGVESRRNSSSFIDWGSFGANILFWTCLTYWLLRKYTIRKAIKIQRNA